MKTRDSLIIELQDIKQEMIGISPKLSVYAKLKEREKQILKLIGDIEVTTANEHGKIKTKDGYKFINHFQKPK